MLARLTWLTSDNSNLTVLIDELSFPTSVQTGPALKLRLYRMKMKLRNQNKDPKILGNKTA